MEERKPRIVWIDLVRVIGALLVVMIHVNSHTLRDWGEIPLSWWMVKNIYNATARIAVPLFFMVSGYLLLQKSDEILFFFRRRGSKILIPFIVWSIIYLIYLDKAPSFRVGVVKILQDDVTAHLWFLYPLIGIYIVVPFLWGLTTPEKRIFLYFFVGMWFIAQPVYTLVDRYLNITIAIPLSFFEGYVGYFVLGYLLGTMKIDRRLLTIGGILWVAADLFTILITYFLTAANDNFSGIFYTYLQPNIILASAGAYMLLMWVGKLGVFQIPRLQKILLTISKASFGIYLIHPLIFKIIRSLFNQIEDWIAHPVWGTPLVTIVLFSISFSSVYLLQKIPILKRTV
jgi:surface polysaccharide O-acyltransferase-like enzyme